MESHLNKCSGLTIDVIKEYNKFTIYSKDGKIILSTPKLLIETTDFYNARSALCGSENSIYLDKVDGLKKGDKITINQEQAGGAALFEKYHTAKITKIDPKTNCIEFSPVFPIFIYYKAIHISIYQKKPASNLY